MISKITVIVILIIFACISVYASGAKPPERILFLGNSLIYYNDGLDNHMEELMSSDSPSLDIEADRYARPYATLKILWGNAIVHKLIEKGNYDVVVLQGDIPEIIEKDIDIFYEFANKFIAEIIEARAEPVLFMAWSYDRVQGIKKEKLGWITMEEIVKAHNDIAEELGVDVAPVGLAMQKAMEERPNFDMLNTDLVHPSVHGTYLAVNVVYATIFEKSPIGLSYLPPSWLGDVTEEEAAFLQRIAWETVQEYQAQQ